MPSLRPSSELVGTSRSSSALIGTDRLGCCRLSSESLGHSRNSPERLSRRRRSSERLGRRRHSSECLSRRRRSSERLRRRRHSSECLSRRLGRRRRAVYIPVRVSSRTRVSRPQPCQSRRSCRLVRSFELSFLVRFVRWYSVAFGGRSSVHVPFMSHTVAVVRSSLVVVAVRLLTFRFTLVRSVSPAAVRFASYCQFGLPVIVLHSVIVEFFQRCPSSSSSSPDEGRGEYSETVSIRELTTNGGIVVPPSVLSVMIGGCPL